MKKLPFLLIAACLLIIIHGCNVDEENEPIGIIGQSDDITDYISEDYALQIANQFAASYDAFAEGSRSSNRRASSRSNIVSSDSYSRAAASPFYIVNYDDGMGFMILSRKNIECPILAFIPEGTYSAAEYANHDGLNFFLACAEDYVNESEFASRVVTVPTAPTYYRIDRTLSMLPIVPVVWAQDTIFGAFCPNKLSGCMATALAQIFTVIRPFDNLKLTYMGVPSDLCPDIDLEWDSIIRFNNARYKFTPFKGVTLTIRDSISDAADHYIISALLREIGHRIKAEYKESVTIAYLDKTLHALKYEFGLVNTTDTFPFLDNLSRLPSNFREGRPVLMLGNAIERKGALNHPNQETSISLLGHAWVSDAYLTFITGTNSRHIAYHCNWGLYPKANGYYSKQVFESKSDSALYGRVKFIEFPK